MKTKIGVTLALPFVLCPTASPHRLDEYLQATTISLAKDRIRMTLLLMPGVSVFKRSIAAIDTNGDGLISTAEKRAYGQRVLRDLSLLLDGNRLKPWIASYRFSPVEAMKKGTGFIEIRLDVPIAPRTGTRKLVFENRHQSSIAAYMVNALVPDDPTLRVMSQNRDVKQSRYELSYEQAVL